MSAVRSVPGSDVSEGESVCSTGDGRERWWLLLHEEEEEEWGGEGGEEGESE